MATPEVNKRNIDAILEYSKETRKQLRDYQDENGHLKNQVEILNSKVVQLESQVRILLVKQNSGGSTSGDHG